MKWPQFGQNLATIWCGQIVVLETPSFDHFTAANWWLNEGFLILAGKWVIRPKFAKQTTAELPF